MGFVCGLNATSEPVTCYFMVGLILRLNPKVLFPIPSK